MQCTSKTKLGNKKDNTAQKKVAMVMHAIIAGQLHAVKSDTITTNRKKGIAIALS